MAAYQAEYRSRDVVRARREAWLEMTKAARSEAYKKWYAANAEERRAKAREWGRLNRDRKRARMQAYMREYTQRPEVKARTRFNRRLREWRERGAVGTATVAQIAARQEMYGNRCAYCGANATTIDHVIPIARGGTNWPANLRPACHSCNSSKRDLPLADFLERTLANAA